MVESLPKSGNMLKMISRTRNMEMKAIKHASHVTNPHFQIC